VSALSGENLEMLLRRVAATLAELPVPQPDSATPARPVLAPEEDKSFKISREPDSAWRVCGPYIEKIVKMTKWDYYDAVMRFQRILEALGITQGLRDVGVEEGDMVRIGDIELEWSD
jgi:GTP-binding protein